MTMESSWVFFLTFLSLFVCTKSDAAARGSIMALIELCDARFAPPEVHLPHHSILAHGWAMPWFFELRCLRCLWDCWTSAWPCHSLHMYFMYICIHIYILYIIYIMSYLLYIYSIDDQWLCMIMCIWNEIPACYHRFQLHPHGSHLLRTHIEDIRFVLREWEGHDLSRVPTCHP